MSINTEKCANWREHVILSCPGIEEMKTIAQTLGIADARWTELRTETVSWMNSLIGSLGEFMVTAELDAFIVRLNQFFYREAMTAGHAFHQSTGALFDCPPESREKWDSVCAAMVAGAFRTTFEGICVTGTSWLSIETKDQTNPPDAANSITDAPDPALAPGSDHAAAIVPIQAADDSR